MLEVFKKISFKNFNIVSISICIFFVVTLSLGVALRSVEILNHNYLFGFDQGRDYLQVRDIVVNKKLTLIGSEIGAGAAGFRGIFQGPFHYYFLAVPFIITNGDPYSGMVLTYLYGLAAIFLMFLIGRKLFGNFGGIFAASLASISPPLISQSRFIWNSHGAPVFVLLTIFFVYKLCQKVSYRYIFAAAFFAAFTYNFQIAIAVPMSLSLIILLIFILRVYDLRKYLVLSLGFILGIAPMILFEFRHNFLGISGIVNYLSSPGEVESSGFLLNIQNQFPMFMYNVSNSFIRQDFLKGEMIGVFLLIASVYLLIREKERHIKKFVTYLLLLPPITFIVLGFLNNSVWDYYLLHLVIAYMLIFVYILFASLRQKKHFITFLVGAFLVVSLVRLFPHFINNIVYDYQDYGGTHKIRGKTDAIDYIYKDAKGKPFELFVFIPHIHVPVNIYSYNYLLDWYAKPKYGYTPSGNQNGTFYILFEGENSKPELYERLKENLDMKGEIVFEKKLSSGFIIQKRENK